MAQPWLCAMTAVTAADAAPLEPAPTIAAVGELVDPARAYGLDVSLATRGT